MNTYQLKQFIQRPFRRLGYQIVRYDANPFSKYEWLKKSGIKTILDVGANEGLFASAMCAVFPNAYIYCFEPLNKCYSRLQSSFKDNSRFQGFNVALSDRNGTTEIFKNEYSPSSSLLEMSDLHRRTFTFTEKQTKETVRLARLDDIVVEMTLERNILLKIDVQGCEMSVLKGAERILNSVSVLIVETSFQQLYEGQASFDEVFDFLRSYGFKFNGFLDQLLSPVDGSVFQADAVFFRFLL